jgi:hypothetical protein
MYNSIQFITFNELITILKHLPKDDSDITVNKNLSLIKQVGQSECILSILKHILSDKCLLADIASRSYHHVNHFDKIVLIDSEDQFGYRLTLHLWNPPYTEKELKDELIHDHRFSFWSNVLTGDLRTENFSRSKAGSVFRRFQYTPEKKTLSNFYEFMGEEILVRTEPFNKTAGESYYLSYETIHKVILPQTTMTCTLVLRGPRKRNFSNVLNTTYPTTKVEIVSSTFSPDELERKIYELRRRIASNSTTPVKINS